MNLIDQLRELHRQVRRLLWLTGVSWFVACLVSGLLVGGLFDWLWRFDDRSLRVGCWVGWLSLIGYVVWTRLVTPLRWPLSNVELSAHLEQRFPMLRGRLTTAVEFLEHDVSPQIGSQELQRSLIEQTTSAITKVDLSEVLDRRHAMRSLLVAASACVIAMLLIVADSASASMAFQRLLWPFGEQRWPQRVELVLVNGDLNAVAIEDSKPLRVVQGEPLDLFFVNARGVLPQSVLLEFRRPGGMAQSEPMRTATLRDSAQQTREAAAIRLPIESGAIDFRAVGGDDHQMPWRRLELIPPPKIATLRVTVIPPSYSGDPELVLPDNATQAQVLLGSRLSVTIIPKQAVTSVSWHDPARDEAIIAKPEGAATPSQPRKYHVETAVTKVGTVTHRVSLIDAHGFQNASAARLDLNVVADPPPSVILMEPLADQFVTAQALVPVQSLAKDDRLINEFFAEYRIGAKEPDLEGTWMRDASTTVVEKNNRKEMMLRGELPISKLLRDGTPVGLGDIVLLRFTASDFCDVGTPRFGHSAVRRLTVVSTEAKSAEIASRLDLLLHDLELLAAREGQAKDQSSALRVQAEKAGALRPEDRDMLKRVELDQRQIDIRLSNPGDSVIVRVRRLLDEVATNRLSDDPSQPRLTEIASTVDRLAKETLPPLEASLSALSKSKDAEEATSADNLVAGLSKIVAAQTVVQSALESLVHGLTQWRDRRELSREIAELAGVQGELNRDVAELTPQTLGKAISQLPPQQQADVAKLADRQARQAERIEQLQQRLNNPSTEATDENKQDHESVARELDRRALATKARDASKEVAENNLGQAARTQQQLSDELKDLAEQLDRTPKPAQQQDISEQAQELSKLLKNLIAQQQTIITETDRLAADQQKAGKWTRPLAKAALNLSEAELAVADATRDLSQALAEFDSVQLLLEHATDNLKSAATRLREKQLDEQTRDQEAFALRLLKVLSDALESQTAEAERPEDKSDPMEVQQEDQSPELLSPIAQLKLLREIQNGVSNVTKGVHKDYTTPETAAVRESTLTNLAAAQESIRDATELLLDRVPLPTSKQATEKAQQDEAAARVAVKMAMQKGSQSLAALESGEPTQAAHRMALEQMDTLEKLWQQRAKNQPSLARSRRPTPQDKSSPDKSGSTTAGDGNRGKPTSQENTQAQNSSDRQDTGADRNATLRGQQRLREAVWGHLPPALREKMLNLPHDKLLPKYSEHIRRYYEALAEQ